MKFLDLNKPKEEMTFEERKDYFRKSILAGLVGVDWLTEEEVEDCLNKATLRTFPIGRVTM